MLIYEVYTNLSLCLTLKIEISLLFGRFSGLYDRPSKDICQLFENHSEDAQNANNTRESQHASPQLLFRISFYSKILSSRFPIDGQGERRLWERDCSKTRLQSN